MPLTYPSAGKFEDFLKRLFIPSRTRKQALSFFKAVKKLSSPKSSFTEKLQSLEEKPDQILELTNQWFKTQGLSSDSIKKVFNEFKKREKDGRLPASMVRGEDIMKHFPNLPKHKFSSVLKRAFDYQMNHPHCRKSDILNSLKDKNLFNTKNF